MSAAPPPRHGAPGLAFAWGWAEAVVFFIVPDVLTSRLVLRSPRDGFTACLCALAGALVGGSLVFWLARQPALAAQVLALYQHLPGVSPALVDRAREGLATTGYSALFVGALSGIPYKLYAVHAGAAGLSFAGFLAASAAARLLRFGAVTGISWAINASLPTRMTSRARHGLHAAAWLAFYAVYFTLMARPAP